MFDGPSLRPIAQALAPLQDELTHLVEQRDAQSKDGKKSKQKQSIFEYRSELTTPLGKQSYSDLTKRIHQTIDQIFSEITQYTATNPLNEQDIQYLQEYERALGSLNKKEIADTLPKLHTLIDQVSSKVLTRTNLQAKEANVPQTIIETFQALPEIEPDIPPGFFDIPIEVIETVVHTQTEAVTPPITTKDHTYHFNKVLGELERLKNRLGGSPNFGDSRPVLESFTKTLFGIPIGAVLDWLTMVLANKWKPQAFWRTIADVFFGFSNQSPKSQYEEAHLRIQRFGLLIANKDFIINILKTKDPSLYSEFGKMTGLAWHPARNSPAVEEEYIRFTEQFLTKYFEDAKAKGDDALVEYFNAFEGVCFEARARNFEAYALQHPLTENAQEIQEIRDIADINTNQSVEKAFDALGKLIADRNEAVTPQALLEASKKNNIFDKQFTEGTGKATPTLKDFQDYVIKCIDDFIMDPYPTVDDFLQMELEILKDTGKTINEENFRAQIQARDGQADFDSESDEVTAFIQKHIAK